MKVALLSDIHANAPALGAVLSEARALKVERLIVTGDNVGYYYQPAETLRLLDEWQWDGIRGNHEDMLLQWQQGQGRDRVVRRYGSGIAEAARQLMPAEIDRLTGMPYTREVRIGERRALLCHGSPWDPELYVYPDADDSIRSKMAAAEVDLVVFGHTHYPVVWADNRDGTLVANPGSVGQPRDRSAGSSWALWDSAANKIDLRRTRYDPRPVQKQARDRDPLLPYLADVLTSR